MKRLMALTMALALAASLAGCSENDKNVDPERTTVTIFSSAEDWREKFLDEKLKAKFPEYKINIEHLSSGPNAARITSEKTNTLCDIVFDLEYGYIEKIEEYLADLSDYDFSIYTDDVVHAAKKVIPVYKNGGCIAVNTAVLADKGLTKPTKYDDLLDEKFRKLVSMPSPKSSGTGYMFLKNLVNVRGEDAAFEYFKKLDANILEWTDSGSGPVTALEQGEVAVALGMTAQAAKAIQENEKNNAGNADYKNPIEILFFDEGSPFSVYGMGMIKGREDVKAVKAVFDYFYDELLIEEKQAYLPEKIYKDIDFFKTYENPYYPNVGTAGFAQYADMSSNTADEKARLQGKWGETIG